MEEKAKTAGFQDAAADQTGDRMIEKAKAYVRELLPEEGDGHGFDHVLRVLENAVTIAKGYPECDRTLVALGAIFHDADDPKLFHTEGNANARRFFERERVPAETGERILRIVNGVSFSQNRGKRPDTLEGRIVQDADRLDAIGAVGIARTFAYGGKNRRPLRSSLEHFHEKLLLLKEEMNTPEAKRMAEERHAFLESFLEEFGKETGSAG